jgi:glycosyltransferase involved in cell wall biosynthesis
VDFLMGMVYALGYRLRVPFVIFLHNIYTARSFRQSRWVRDVQSFKPQLVLVAPCTEALTRTAVRAKRLTGAKLMVKTSLHLESESATKLSRIFAMLKHADALLVNTVYERDVLLPHVAEPSNIHLISVGIDLNDCLHQYPESEVDENVRTNLSGKPYVLYLGRKQEGKGMEALVKAMSVLQADIPGLFGVLAGEETDYSQGEFLKCIADKPYVVSVGYVRGATKQWLLRNARVFCMVSRVDSYGIVYCESWAQGIPVIAADTPQIRCVVESGVNGYVVPYDDDKKLADVIGQLMKDPQKASLMGENGRQKVLRDFGNQAVEKKIHALALQLAGTST